MDVSNNEISDAPDALHSRREFIARGAAGLAGLMGLYVLDRSDPIVKGINAVNPFHEEPRPLVPEAGKTEKSLRIPWLPTTVSRWEEPITAMADRYAIDPNLVAILMTLESGGYSRAGSAAGARGLMQIMPPTEKDIARKFLKGSRMDYDIWDPETNVEFGSAYIRYLIDLFGKPEHGPTWNQTVELVAAGYNGGPGAAQKLLKGIGLESIETLSYSRDALNMWRERRAPLSPTYLRWYKRGGMVLINKALAEKQP